MSKITLVEADRPDDEANYFASVDELKKRKLHKNTKFILCDCTYGDTCANGKGDHFAFKCVIPVRNKG